MRRPVLLVVFFALGLTLVSTLVPGRMTVTYPDIMGCEVSCEVAAAGFPLPFVVDYPAFSPGNQASLSGALLGLDHLHQGRAAATFGCWLAACGALVWALRRTRAIRT